MNADEEKRARRNKRILVAIVGVVLALACRALPPEYQNPCQIIVNCGGIP